MLALLTGVAANPAKRRIEFEPDVERNPDGVELVGTAWLLEVPGLTLVLKQLRNEERQSYLAQNLGLTADPFASRPDQPERYLTFQFVMENRGTGDLAFNPRSAWLYPSDNKVRSAIGLTELSFDYKVLGGELPAAYDKIRRVLFEETVHVRAGDAVSGLLVFRPMEAHVRRFDIDLRVVVSSADVVPFRVPYRRVEEEKKKRKKRRGRKSSQPEPVAGEGER